MSLFSRMFGRDGSEGEGAEGSAGESKEGSDPKGGSARSEAADTKSGADGKAAASQRSARDEPTEKIRTSMVTPGLSAKDNAAGPPALPKQGREPANAVQDRSVRAGEPPVLPAASSLAQPAFPRPGTPQPGLPQPGTPALGIPSVATKEPSGMKPLPQPSGIDAASRTSTAMPAPATGLGVDKKVPTKKVLIGTGAAASEATRPAATQVASGGKNSAQHSGTSGALPATPATSATAALNATPAVNAIAAPKPTVAHTPGAITASASAVASEPGRHAPTVSASAPTKITRAELATLATHHIKPLINFMLELRWGTATSAWAGPCVAALRALSPLVSRLEAPPASEAIELLLAVLERTHLASGCDISDAAREEMLQGYSILRHKCGLGTDLELERSRREPLVVDELLLQTEGVHVVCIEKVYAAGFCTIERILLTNADELSQLSGIELELATRIVGSFRTFREEFPTAAPDPLCSLEKRQLSTLLEELRQQEQRFERASSGWSHADLQARRTLRVERARNLHKVHAILARLGEIERIGSLERLPHAGKLSELAAFVRSDASAAA